MATHEFPRPHPQEPEPEPEKQAVDTSRRTAHEIFESAAELGREELHRPAKALFFSGLAGGLTMGLTGLAVAAVRAMLGPGSVQEFVALLLYPVGFIAVIIGRSQLFTENTLYPVVLILSERDHILDTARLWVVVFVANVIGAGLFALLAVRTGALRGEFAHELMQLGLQAVNQPLAHVFWTGIIGGWLIALVAWMVTASHWTIGQIAVIWLLAFVVGIGHFAHCIATSGEILSAVVGGASSLPAYAKWLAFATLGNIVGGVTIVSLLNYGQVKAGETEA